MLFPFLLNVKAIIWVNVNQRTWIIYRLQFRRPIQGNLSFEGVYNNDMQAVQMEFRTHPKRHVRRVYLELIIIRSIIHRMLIKSDSCTPIWGDTSPSTTDFRLWSKNCVHYVSFDVCLLKNQSFFGRIVFSDERLSYFVDKRHMRLVDLECLGGGARLVCREFWRATLQEKKIGCLVSRAGTSAGDITNWAGRGIYCVHPYRLRHLNRYLFGTLSFFNQSQRNLSSKSIT